MYRRIVGPRAGLDGREREFHGNFCVILPQHDLCIRNAFRMVMSVRWKTKKEKDPAGNSIAVEHSDLSTNPKYAL
jgi:hypothetical protein